MEENSLSKSSMNMAGTPQSSRNLLCSSLGRFFFFFAGSFSGGGRSDFIKERFGVKHFLDMGEIGTPNKDVWIFGHLIGA